MDPHSSPFCWERTSKNSVKEPSLVLFSRLDVGTNSAWKQKEDPWEHKVVFGSADDSQGWARDLEASHLLPEKNCHLCSCMTEQKNKPHYLLGSASRSGLDPQ